MPIFKLKIVYEPVVLRKDFDLVQPKQITAHSLSSFIPTKLMTLHQFSQIGIINRSPQQQHNSCTYWTNKISSMLDSEISYRGVSVSLVIFPITKVLCDMGICEQVEVDNCIVSSQTNFVEIELLMDVTEEQREHIENELKHSLTKQDWIRFVFSNSGHKQLSKLKICTSRGKKSIYVLGFRFLFLESRALDYFVNDMEDNNLGDDSWQTIDLNE